MANEEVYKAEIRRSFALVEPIAVQAAAIFYPTLWEVNPNTKVSRALFVVRGLVPHAACFSVFPHLGQTERPLMGS